MGANYWRGIPVDRLPSRIFRAEYARLSDAIAMERERIRAHQDENGADTTRSIVTPDGNGEGITGELGADRGEPKDGEGVPMREALQVARNIVHNVVVTPFYALRCACGWHSWQHVRRLSFPDRGAMPTRWHSYDACAHCRRINLASETFTPWRPGDADGE